MYIFNSDSNKTSYDTAVNENSNDRKYKFWLLSIASVIAWFSCIPMEAPASIQVELQKLFGVKNITTGVVESISDAEYNKFFQCYSLAAFVASLFSGVIIDTYLGLHKSAMLFAIGVVCSCTVRNVSKFIRILP